MPRYRNRCRRNGNGPCNRNGCRCNGYNPCNREDDDDNVIIIPDVPFVPVIGERSAALLGWSRHEPVMHVYRNPQPTYMCGCYCPTEEEEENE